MSRTDDESRDMVDDEPRDRVVDDETIFPSGGWATSWAPGLFSTERDERTEAVTDDTVYDESDRTDDSDDGGWLDEGVITALLVVGLALFLFPEPATSGIGIFLISLGVLGWLLDLATTET